MRNQAKHRRGRPLRLKLSAAAVASAAAFGGTAWALQQSGSDGAGADRPSGPSTVHVTSVVPSASAQPEHGLLEADSGHRDATPAAKQKKDPGSEPAKHSDPATAGTGTEAGKPKPARTGKPAHTRPARPKPPASTPTPRPSRTATPPTTPTPTPTPTPTHTPDPAPPATTPPATPPPPTTPDPTTAPSAGAAHTRAPQAAAPRATTPQAHGRGYRPWLPFPAAAPGHTAGAPGGTDPVG
ncbi:hypothetical protein PV392_02405 [Streptomyces sp. ME03-5709C]|nr:hypothetical protein [Streptomyces sp. ME03-5709C]